MTALVVICLVNIDVAEFRIRANRIPPGNIDEVRANSEKTKNQSVTCKKHAQGWKAKILISGKTVKHWRATLQDKSGTAYNRRSQCNEESEKEALRLFNHQSEASSMESLNE